MKQFLKIESANLKNLFAKFDRKVFIIFLSVAIIQTISWYFTSRNFFRENFYYEYFDNNSSADLYEFLYWFISDSVLLFFVPLIIIVYLLKDKIKNYGLRLGDFQSGIKFIAVFLVIITVIAYLLSGIPEFAKYYPYLKESKYDWTTFIIFELGALIFMFAWEFIWRGFMLFGLEEKFGVHSILIQMLPFVILHNGKPFAETISAIIGAILLGYLALRTRSIYYGVAIHFSLFFFMDLFSVIR